jgi:hypothetical protein
MMFGKMQEHDDVFHGNFSRDQMRGAMSETQCLQTFGGDE